VRGKGAYDNQAPQKDQLPATSLIPIMLRVDDKNICTLLIKSADGWENGLRDVSFESSFRHFLFEPL